MQPVKLLLTQLFVTCFHFLSNERSKSLYIIYLKYNVVTERGNKLF